ncbi:hypothetical protein HYS03_01865 [Candidatus Woesebacteria bacterium]|nr:hypothetical protein [Candidatus Woesebacteria bacterium]QQG47883.1 MAG: hypothetical protein HY044_02240 [Candidatus Woesebacteria bacterium]
MPNNSPLVVMSLGDTIIAGVEKTFENGRVVHTMVSGEVFEGSRVGIIRCDIFLSPQLKGQFDIDALKRNAQRIFTERFDGAIVNYESFYSGHEIQHLCVEFSSKEAYPSLIRNLVTQTIEQSVRLVDS